MSDWLGWIATGVFTSSYLFKRADSLRLVQMIAALMWIAYGVLVGALPVVVANLLVLGAAALATWSARSTRDA
ncbi:MAG: lactate dehydrogenase [Acidobacteriota bacterium]|jgi:uncharacterized protein with PQ loop repeat|nr:lactate dehydrogenase [Acidobacteriota bacterium]